MLISGCVNDVHQIEDLNKQSVQIEVAHHILSYYSRSGKVNARLTAPLLYRYLDKQPYVVLNQGLKVEFYNDSQEVSSTLTARIGEYFSNNNMMVVRDSVVVVNQKGERLECQKLTWDASKQQFFTHDPVKIITANEIIYGDGLIANENFTWHEIIHPHNSQIRVSSGKLP
ncbi:MAG TPA: LPS export ABC transporter periplasmic protein LptC [Chitinophagaceae bacterium]|nr:LPS export ABC transporter periplasmic protein LptC [Chitinophagaceae bacterium]